MNSANAAASFNIRFFDENLARRRRRGGKRHVVGYARLSFDEDGTGYASIINQLDILKAFYAEKLDDGNSELTTIYDDNVSGYKFERPGLFQVINRIESGQCDIIIAKDLSRIGRHSALTQLFIESCERVGVRVIAMEDYDSHKESDDIILGIKAWSNERVVKDTSAKILKVVRHKQENGTWFCAAPYGYIVNDYVTADVVIDEESAPVIRNIFEMYLSGKGINKICQELMRGGVPTPSMRARELSIQCGKPYNKKVSRIWNPGQMSKLLADEFYTGCLVTGRYKRAGINGIDVRTEKTEQKVFAEHHPAIIPREMFEAAQRLRRTHVREAYRPGKNGETLFHGLLYCGDCGARLYTYKRAGLDRQYICSAYFRGLGCSRHMIKEETLTKIAISVLKTIRDNFPAVMKSLDAELAAERRRLRDGTEGTSALMTELQTKRTEMRIIEEQRIRQLAAHPERSEIISSTYDSLAAATQETIEKLEKSIAGLEAKENTLSPTLRASTYMSAMATIDAIIASGQIRRTDVEALFRKIEVFADKRVQVELLPDLEGIIPEPMQIETRQKAPRATKKTEPADHVAKVVCEGDPLEIFTDHDGEVVLKKYSPIGEIAAIARDYTDSLYRSLGHAAVICDRDMVVALSGTSRKELADKPVSPEMERLMLQRQTMRLNAAEGARMLPVTQEDDASYTAQTVVPIVSDGDVIGALLLLSRETGARMTDIDQKVAETTAGIVGRQMEQ